MKVISLDCESNGLGGKAFAVAAILTDESGEVDRWVARSPITGPVDGWVAENVIPALADLDETCNGYNDLAIGWRDFFGQHREAATVIAHIPWPVEARFLRYAHEADLFAGPYPLIDVAPLLLAAAHDPTSVDTFLSAHNLPKPTGSPHHPLYDAQAAETAFRHLMEDARVNRFGVSDRPWALREGAGSP